MTIDEVAKELTDKIALKLCHDPSRPEQSIQNAVRGIVTETIKTERKNADARVIEAMRVEMYAFMKLAGPNFAGFESKLSKKIRKRAQQNEDFFAGSNG